jgi:hypothetical protein
MKVRKTPSKAQGRFARVLKAGVKVVVGTVKTVKRAHKTIKRVRANARRRSNLEMRERRIALVERERKAGVKRGMKRKKVTRRRRK